VDKKELIFLAIEEWQLHASSSPKIKIPLVQKVFSKSTFEAAGNLWSTAVFSLLVQWAFGFVSVSLRFAALLCNIVQDNLNSRNLEKDWFWLRSHCEFWRLPNLINNPFADEILFFCQELGLVKNTAFFLCVFVHWLIKWCTSEIYSSTKLCFKVGRNYKDYKLLAQW
jgi:hypothetical protein